MSDSKISLARVNTLGVGAALGVLALAAGPAGAQSAATAPESSTGALEELVITGTHIASSGYTAPTPVTVVGQERLEQRGFANVADALNELPSFRPLITPATQQAVGGNIGARVLDLRGLGATRTLVLLDGKRFVPSTTLGTIDANLIPSSLIKRTEVVTGGASAAYGSDAVAGVVNFILDKNLEGFKGSLQYGFSQQHDDKDTNASLAFGTALMGGSTHLLLAMEYDDSDGMGDCYTRVWCPKEQAIPNSAPGAGGLPARLRIGPDSPGNLNQDGLINTTSGPLRGITFNPNGTTHNFQYGQIFGTNLSPLFMLGGEGTSENGYLQGILMAPPVQRVTLFSHLDHVFGDSLKGNLDVSFGQVKGTIVGSEARATNFAITPDNPFLPASVATLMTTNNIASFTLGRVFGDLGGSVDHSDNKTYRAVASLEGAITGTWNWDAYYQYGRNKFNQVYTGDVVLTRLTNAINAVSSGGQIVCRINADANPANDDPACVPFNVFGRGNSSAAARAYVAPTGYQTLDTTENVLAGNLHGDILTLPGGPLSMATGLEYRNDKMVGGADALSTANALWSFNGKAINGQIEVKEGYVEAVAPLLSKLALANLLELNGAIRRTSYDRSNPSLPSTTADATTWKLGIVYEPIEEVRLRATRSRDIRAPNLAELYGPVTAGRVTITQVPTGQIASLAGSNPLLTPEKADTSTVGVVLSPAWSFAPSLRLSVDYFDISIDGAIASLGAQTVVTRCLAGATEFCPFVTFGTPGVPSTITAVQDVLQNAKRQVNRGVDFEASYTERTAGLGTFDYRLLATKYLESSLRDSIGVVDRVGQTGYQAGGTSGVPDYIIDGLVTWNIERWTTGAHMHYIPKGVFDPTYVGPEDPGYSINLTNSINTNRVDARFYLDLNAGLKVGEHSEVYAVVNNVFDKDPPLAASAQGGTNQIYFDPVGRYFKIGVRVKM